MTSYPVLSPWTRDCRRVAAMPDVCPGSVPPMVPPPARLLEGAYDARRSAGKHVSFAWWFVEISRNRIQTAEAFSDTASFKWGYPNCFGVALSSAPELFVASAVPFNPNDLPRTTTRNFRVARHLD